MDSRGNKVWDKFCGGGDVNDFNSLIQTSDGAYIVAGHTYFKGFLIKIDSQGHLSCERTFGGKGSGVFNSLISTSDGGYAVAGWTAFKEVHYSETWILKLDSYYNIIWDSTYSKGKNNYISSLVQTFDGGYIATGRIGSKYRLGDALILKLDFRGDKIWDKTYGRGEIKSIVSLVQTSNGGYVIAGWIGSERWGEKQTWILKLDEMGNLR
jgi:hypothetical protein